VIAVTTTTSNGVYASIVQPAANVVNKYVIQPIVTNIVNPIVKNVLNPIVNNVIDPVVKAAVTEAQQFPGQVVSLGSSASNTIRNVGSTLWQDSQQSGLALHDFISSHVHISDMNKFIVGALKCAAVVGLVVGAFVAPEVVLPSISAAEMAVAVSGAAGVAYVYSGFSMAQYAKDWVDLGQTVVDFGNGCVDMASTVSFS